MDNPQYVGAVRKWAIEDENPLEAVYAKQAQRSKPGIL